MKTQISIWAFALTIFLTACGPSRDALLVKDDGKIEIKFIQLNDVYEISPLGAGKYAGLARVAHVADSVRRVNPNTYLMIAGDFLNPSLLGTLEYQGERIKGRQMIEVLNSMGMDMATFGNHEFDLKLEELQQRINESEFPWMSSNAKVNTGDTIVPFYKVRNGNATPIPEELIWQLSDADGTTVSVGFYGPVLNENPVPYVHYGNVLDKGREAYERLKDSVDLIVGLTHLAIDQDLQLAGTCPETVLIMGGHEHENNLLKVGRTTIAKADANAKTVYLHTLTWDRTTGQSQLESILFPIDDRLAEAPGVKAVVEKWEAIQDQQVRQVIPRPREVIYTAQPAIDGLDSSNRSKQTNLGELVTGAMIASFDEPPQAALINGGSFRIDDMLQGPVTGIDIMRVLPFGGHLLKVDITADLLKEVLDYGLSKKGTGAYLQRGHIDRGPDGTWLVNGEALVGGKTYYTIAISDFLLKGYDIPFLTADNTGILAVYKPSETEPAHDIRKAVMAYLKSPTK